MKLVHTSVNLEEKNLGGLIFSIYWLRLVGHKPFCSIIVKIMSFFHSIAKQQIYWDQNNAVYNCFTENFRLPSVSNVAIHNDPTNC